jgi:hypothetical protein
MGYYEDVYLDSIIIDTQKTYSALGPSSNPLMTIDCGHVKHYRTYLDIDSIADNMFFVYVISTGEPSDDTPCGLDTSMIMGVTYDKYPMYLQGMKLINELDGCEPAGNFIDYILTNKAFEICLLTGNYTKAIEYWNQFFDEKEKNISSKCGCHGRVK